MRTRLIQSGTSASLSSRSLTALPLWEAWRGPAPLLNVSARLELEVVTTVSFLVLPVREGSCYSYQTTGRCVSEQDPMGPSRGWGVCGVVRAFVLSPALAPL